MRISLNWIERILGVDSLGLSDDELVGRLTMHLAEIEAIERSGPSLDGVVVGRVLTREQHPDADRLSCCTVDVGGPEPLPIVCGAANVAAGQSVAVATIGTQLTMPGKDGEPVSITIKKGKLRGQPSMGMICAEDELGLGDSHDGIMVLDDAPAPGTPLDQVVSAGDRVLVIDNHNINHRPDLWGHLGWAREIAAICDLPAPAAPTIAQTLDPQGWSVDLQDAGCRAYRGAVVENVSNVPSPEWMREALASCGERSRGLLVDVTNYVMLELGEPMHAFDRRQISGETIIVRSAAEGEAFTTLDDREHSLHSDDMLIADRERALALAGIMGGQNSMIMEDTSCIVLEAATFQQGRIRKTRQTSGCSSESSSRFEKGLYVELTAAAIERAIAIICAAIPEARVAARFLGGEAGGEQTRIAFDPSLTDKALGVAIPADQQYALLAKLGIERDGSELTVPWWRAKDVSVAVDLVEEVGRLYGYERIAAEVPRLPAAAPHPNLLRRAEHSVRRRASGIGWDEVATYGFSSEEWATALDWPQDQLIRMVHPLSSEQTVLRYSLLPTLLEAVAANRRHLDTVQLYEVGKIYGHGLGTGICADERLMVAGACSAHGEETPFYAARDAAIELISALGHQVSVVADESPDAASQAGRAAKLLLGSTCVGLVAEVPAAIRKRLRLGDGVAHFRIELEQLLAQAGEAKPIAHQGVSRFQQVEREFTFVCNERLTWAELETVTRQAAGKLCQGVDLVTIYRGEQIDADQKAVSLKVQLQSDEKTLSEKDLNKTQQKIIKSVENRLGATIRA